MKTFITKRVDEVYTLFGFIFLIGVYVIISLIKNNILVPKLDLIITDFYNLVFKTNALFLVFKTILKLVIATILSFSLSIVLAYFSYKSKRFSSFLKPLIAFLRCSPVACVILILILVVGVKQTPIYICLFVITPINYEVIKTILSEVDKDVLDEIKLNSKINFKIVLLLIIPMSFNYLISCVVSSIGLGLKVIIMGEILAQGNNTIGGSIQVARANLISERVFSWAILILIIVIIIEYLIAYFKKKVLKL